MEMKKLVAVMMACLLLSMVTVPAFAAEKSTAAAAVLSSAFAGAGEWYNSDFQGSFPWGECLVGYICFCFHISSIFDAANGAADTQMRIDFWSAPSN